MDNLRVSDRNKPTDETEKSDKPAVDESSQSSQGKIHLSETLRRLWGIAFEMSKNDLCRNVENRFTSIGTSFVVVPRLLRLDFEPAACIIFLDSSGDGSHKGKRRGRKLAAAADSQGTMNRNFAECVAQHPGK